MGLNWNYTLGEEFAIKCTLPRSRIPAKMSLFLNDKEIETTTEVREDLGVYFSSAAYRYGRSCLHFKILPLKNCVLSLMIAVCQSVVICSLTESLPSSAQLRLKVNPFCRSMNWFILLNKEVSRGRQWNCKNMTDFLPIPVFQGNSG